MVCIYNPTAEQLNALDNYQRVLGSEEAAYYVLSLNNGFPLDKTPSGEDSDVYQELLLHYGNEDEAIRMKSIMYTSKFLESNGDWTMGTLNDPTMFDSKGEPLANLVTGTISKDLQDILNHQFLLDSNATVVEADLANVKPTDNLSDYAVDQLLKMSYDRYVTEKNAQYIKDNPNSTEDERLLNRITLSRQWYSRKVEKIMTEQVRALAKAFGFIYIQRPNGSIELQTTKRSATTGVQQLRLKFLNSIVQDPLEDELRTQVLGLPRSGETTTLKVEGAPDYMHDAILRHIQNDRMLAANTLIKVSLNGGTSTTINKALAYNYITMFIDSPLIDAGLQAVDDGKGRSKLYLVNKLVEEITSPTIAGVKNSSILEKTYKQYKQGVPKLVFDDFWTQFDELLNEVITKGVKSEQAKQKILSVVAAAFQTNDTYNIYTRPALYSAVPHYDYYADWYSSKYKPWGELNKKEISTTEQFLNTLATFYQNKIKRQERDPYVTKESGVRTQQALHTLEQTDMSNPVEVEKAIANVLDVAYQEISDADRIIDSLNLNTIGVVKQLANLGSEYMNVIGFYNYIVNVQLKAIFPDKNKAYPNLDLLYKAVQILLSNLQTKYKDKLEAATKDYVSFYIDRYVDKNVVTEELIRNMKANIHAELINDAIFGDLKNYELWLTMNSVSVSQLVRQVADSIMRLNFNRDQMTLDVAQQIQIALNKAKLAVAKRPLTWGGYTFAPRNFLMLFQERLDDGTPSGMFVRKYHYGNFFKRRKEYIQELVLDINKDIQNKTGNTHFRIETDRYGNPIFQEGPEWETYRKDYELKLNAFECTYGNKRFLLEYYDLRIQLLSEDTMAAQDDIQKRIDIILKGVTRDDVTYLNELSIPERRQLDDLYREQDNLSNAYTLGGEEKTGTGLRMAQEIKAFRKAIKNRILYETDQQKFDDALNTITDPTERQAFIDASTERDINPEWWDIYKVLQKEYRDQFPDYLQDCFDDIDELTDERNDIINTVKTGRYAQPELRRLSDSAWDRLKELDELIEAAYEPIIDYLKNLPQGSQKIPSAFKQIAEIRDVMDYINPTKTAYDAFILEAEDKDAQESMTLGYTVHTHEIEARRKYSRMVRIGPNVKEVPLSAFGYMSPSVFPDHIKKRFNIPDNFEYVKDLPKRFYNKIVDPKSKKYVATPIVNTDFDESEGTYLQPKELNPNYQMLADPKQTPEEVFELYQLCLDVKEAADSLIPSVSSQSRAKLPQMRASDLALISRVFSRGMLKTVGDVFTNNFVSNETDDDIIDDFTTLPDGTRANNVPLKFIQNLPDMSLLTSDVVGSIVAYYYMAANNYFKAEVAPLYQALLQQVAQDQYIITRTENDEVRHLILGDTTNLHAKLKNVIDSLLYDQKLLWGERGSQSLKGSQRTGFKTAKFFAKLGTIAALSRNILSQTTGFIDAERKLHAFAFSGEAFNMKNIAFAIGLFDSYLVSGRLFMATGEIIPHNLIAAIHQKNNLGTGIEYKYQGGYKNQVRRVVGMERSGMGGFRISDYAITSVIALAIYDNYRLLDNEFLPEISFKNKLKRQGLSRSEINKRYNKALTLLDAYDYDSGFLGIFKRQGEKFKLKLQYQLMLGKQGVAKLEQNVAKAIHTWAPKCNGAVSDEDKAVIQQNILAGFTVALRSYLLNESQTRFAKGRDFQDPNMSERKLRILKKKRNALIKAYKSIKTDSKKKTLLDKLMDEKSKIEAELLSLGSSGNEKSLNWSNIRILFGLSAFEGTVGWYVGSVFGIYGASIGATAGIIHGVVSARSNLRMKGGADVFKSKLQKLQEKLHEIDAKIYANKSSDNKDILLTEIMQLNESIAEIEESINENQGYYDYARNIVTNGSNRLAGRALMNAIRNLYYYINIHMPRAFQSLKATHPIKITDLQIRGLKRLVADFVNLSILWLSTTYMLSWYRYDDGRAFLGGAFNEQTTALMHKTDKLMEDAIRPVMESEPWKDTWLAIHDSSTEGIISDIATIPLFAGMDKAIEQKSDAMLGYNKKVSRKDKSVKRIKQDPVLRLISWLKCFGAVQSLKGFTEQITPYDPQTINDLTNAVSANMNVISKELEASQQMMVEYKQGTLDDPMQGGPYQSYFNRYEYGAAHSWQRPFGFPSTFEQTTEIGDINRLNFLLGTGLNKYVFDKKKPELKKKKKSKSKKRKGGYGR